MTDFYSTKLALSAAAQSAMLCHFMAGGAREYHIGEMRDSVVDALSGCKAGTPLADCRAELLDVIETAITDSFDQDWTAKDGAESVLRALLDNIAPMPVKQEASA